MAELNAWLKQWENNLVNLEKPHKKELKISYLSFGFWNKKVSQHEEDLLCHSLQIVCQSETERRKLNGTDPWSLM